MKLGLYLATQGQLMEVQEDTMKLSKGEKDLSENTWDIGTS